MGVGCGGGATTGPGGQDGTKLRFPTLRQTRRQVSDRPQAPHMKPSPPRGGIADPLFLIALYIERYNPGVCPLGSGNFGVQGTRYMRFFLLWPLYLCFEGILV